MAIKFNRSQTFSTNGTVTAAGLHNLIDGTDIYQALITDQPSLTAVDPADSILIADASLTAGDAPRQTTVSNLFDDALTGGTYTNLNLTGALTFGTATGNRTVSTSATITTGTIPNLTAGTTTSTAATITNGTITTALIPTLTVGTTTGTVGIFTSGTVTTLNSTTGTIATLNITTGTIGNLSTTLAGDFTISQGTATLATSGATAGTYGSVTAIPFITVDTKGRITSATTGTFSSTPADGSITPVKLSQPFTSGTAVASTSGTAIDFTGIPSWAKRITIIFNGVSTNGNSPLHVKLGTSSGLESTGYVGTSSGFLATSSNAEAMQTTGFSLYVTASAALNIGQMVITTVGSNVWIASYNIAHSGATYLAGIGNGNKTLAGTLDRVRITTVNGTDTFDAGSVNIMYEG